MKLSIILSIILLLPGTVSLKAQQDKDTTTQTKWEWDDEKWAQFNFDFFEDEFTGAPTISLIYGLSGVNIKNFSTDFADAGLWELKLGHTTNKYWRSTDILKHKFSYLYVGNYRPGLKGADVQGLETNMWRFGAGWSNGFGYRLSENAFIIPYYSTIMNWSRIRMVDDPLLPAEKNKTDLYNESFRFGTGSEAGIRIGLFDHFIIEGGYEKSLIFQRHLFWKWAGSALIEVILQYSLDEFIDEIMESSPYTGPVVNVLLKGALAYGIYELRKDKMNWPFSSEAPVSYDQVRFGVTFIF